MSKAVDSRQFRCIDIDAYDEEAYQDDKSAEITGSQEVSDRAGQVKQLLMSSKCSEALTLALTDPPIGHLDVSVKEENYQTVMSVLKAFRTTDIDSAISSLSPPEVDVLMKYLYKGFSCNPDKAASLLLWHEQAVKKGGLGSIVRVMVDRRGV